MEEKDLDVVLVMNPRDVFYYTGTGQPANLLVPRQGEPLLQVRRAWDFAAQETWLEKEHLMKGGSMEALKEKTEKDDFPIRHMGITTDAIPANLAQKIEKTFTSCHLINASPLILEQRSIKDNQEITAIKNAAACFLSIHETIMRELRPGISELFLSSKILQAVREAGADSITRNRRWDASLPPDGIVASSKTSWQISGHAMTVTGKGLSPALPWGASQETIDQGDLVIVDIGINYQGYHADIARTYVVGSPNQRQKESFNQVFSLQESALSSVTTAMADGKEVKAEDVYWSAYKKAEELGITPYFQGHGEMQGDYIGHGLGLEMDELPVLQRGSKTILSPGMVFAVEPKLIIPHWDAVVLEDDVVVTETGWELLSPIPRKLFEVDN